MLLAVRIYSSAILKSNQTSLRAYLNRAQCYLKLARFYLAYEDAKKASEIDPGSEKAFYRMAKAAYHLGKYCEARQGFARCIELNAGSEAAPELEKTNKRIKEMESGEYDWCLITRYSCLFVCFSFFNVMITFKAISHQSSFGSQRAPS